MGFYRVSTLFIQRPGRQVSMRRLLAVLLAVTVYASRVEAADYVANAQHEEHSGKAWTLESLESLALERNPTLVQANAQINISRGAALQAGLYPNPTVGYTAEQIGSEGTAGELQGGFVEQEIVTGNKLQLSRSKYEQEVLQAQVRLEAQQYRVRSSIRREFYRTLVTQHQIEVRRELLKNAEEALKTTQGLVNVGQANKPDLLQAQVQVMRVKAQLRAAERKYYGHWQELIAQVGAPDLAPAPLNGTVELQGDQALDGEAVLHDLLNCSPQLRAAWAEVARDRISVQREAVEPIPNLNVRAETGYNFESQDTVAGLSIGIKLPIFDKNQGSILQARAELARAEAEVKRIELVLRQKFGSAIGDYEAALVEARTLQDEALPAAREAYQLYSESYKNRRAAWPQVLVAQREYFQLTDEYLEAVLEVRRAEADMLGLFLGDGLAQPETPTPEGHRDATPRPR